MRPKETKQQENKENVRGEVNPHKGEELTKVLGGKKPLGSIRKSRKREYEEVLEDCANDLVYALQHDDIIVFALDTYYLKEYTELVYNTTISQTYRQIMMGRLFGYSKLDVEAYWVSGVDCKCAQCVGASYSRAYRQNRKQDENKTST